MKLKYTFLNIAKAKTKVKYKKDRFENVHTPIVCYFQEPVLYIFLNLFDLII